MKHMLYLMGAMPAPTNSPPAARRPHLRFVRADLQRRNGE